MYKIVMIYSDGTREEDDELFESEAEAEDYGQMQCSNYSEGNEILHMSNPGDYPLDEEGADFEVVEA